MSWSEMGNVALRRWGWCAVTTLPNARSLQLTPIISIQGVKALNYMKMTQGKQLGRQSVHLYFSLLLC